MTEITAAMVKELRERTGAGISDCKKALVESEGDYDRAIDILREKGLAAAAKKAGRIASEGLVTAVISPDGKNGVIAEINSETDFVAKNQEFRNFVSDVAGQALASDAFTVEELLAEKWQKDGSMTVSDALTGMIARVGEKISIRRFEKFSIMGAGVLVNYIHGGGRVCVMIELGSDVADDALIEAGKNVCMQIAAMSPAFISRADVSEEFMSKEKEILTQQALNEDKPKPANIIEKMVVGRLEKNLKEMCLLEQEYVKDQETTVRKYLESVGLSLGCAVTVRKMARYETGEGIEKREENFAEEVSKAMTT